MIIVPKLWGHERIIQNDPVAGYCLKQLTVDPAGYASSVHYHVNKTETFFVIEGRIFLELYARLANWWTLADPRDLKERRIWRLHTNDHVTLPLFTPHRFWALDYAGVFIEGSSHDDPSDSYRIIQSGAIPIDYDPTNVQQYPC